MRRREEQAALILIVRFLKEKGGLTSYQLAEQLGLNVRNVRPYMKILHTQNKVFIEGWKKRSNGPLIPIWRLDEIGDCEDEPYPKALTPAERVRILRKRKNANVTIKASIAACPTLRR
jgi:predicted ArsR family transcriptional regulator